MRKFDELLEKIGEFGPYQKRVYVTVSLAAVLAGYQAMAPVFLLNMNNYRCKLPSYDNDTYAIQNAHHESLINSTVPLVVDSQGETTYSECNLYNISNQSLGYSNNSQFKCNEWVYDMSVIQTSGFTEFNMVCEHEIFRSHTNMIDFSGALCGSVLFGPIGDTLGRKKTLMFVFFINCVANVAISFSTQFIVYAAITFVLGLTGRVMFMLSFVHALEIVGPSTRTLAGVGIEFFWTAGLFMLTGVAYLVRQWRHLNLALGIPSILILSYKWIIPESPRWLISRGRITEATKIMKKIAKSNGIELDEMLLQDLTVHDENETQTRIWHILKYPSMILRALIIFFNWFAINIVYYGLSLNVGNMSGDIYLNFFLSSLMELVAYSLTLIMLNKVGRKTLHCVSMILGGLACLATIFPVIYGAKSSQWTLMALAMVGKLGATTAFSVIYIFSAELFPTVVRQSALGMCALFEGIAGMVAPYMADLGILVKGSLESALPLIVFGSLTIAAGCLATMLPETRNRKLPETVADAFKFGNTSSISHDERQNIENIPINDVSVAPLAPV